MRQKAVFLDRDGIINQDFGYVYRTEDFKFVEGFPQLALFFKKLGYLLIVVTNQSGVARGFYTMDDVQVFHDYVNQCLRKTVGIELDGFYVCPHHPKGKIIAYAKECNCRKPGTGLIKQVLNDFSINMEDSFILGDKDSDVELGHQVGMKGFQISNRQYAIHPHANGVFSSIGEFQRYLENKSSLEH